MTRTDWLPGLLALGLGLLAAVVVLLLGRRRGASKANEDQTPVAGKAGEEAELRAARLLDQLRELEADRHQLSSETYKVESSRLERLAADALRERDEARTSARKPRRGETSPVAPASSGFFGRHPQLAGAFWGAGVVAFFGALGLWLTNDAKPRSGGEVATGTAGRDEMPAPAPAPEDPAFTAALARARENPADVETSAHVVHELLRREDYEEAKDLTERSLGVDPFQSEARVHQAFLLAVGGDEPAASRELLHLTELYPNTSEAFLFLGMIRMRAGDNPGAADAFGRFLAESPADQLPPQLRSAVNAIIRQLKGPK